MAGSAPFKNQYEELTRRANLLKEQISGEAGVKAAGYGIAPIQRDYSSAARSSPYPSGEVLGAFGGALGDRIFNRSESTPWNFNSGLNFLPSGSSGTSTNFSTAGLDGPAFAPTTLNFFR